MVFLFFFANQAYFNIKENGPVLNVILYYIQFCSDYFCLTIATLNSPVGGWRITYQGPRNDFYLGGPK